MSEFPITVFDMGVIGVLLISAIIGFARGFVREALSIAAFVAAFLASIWGTPSLAAAAKEAIQPEWLAMALVIIGLFLAVYVAVTMVTNSITNLVHSNRQTGFFDRTLGFVFGVARGLILVALGFLIYGTAFTRDKWPDDVTRAQTLPLVEGATEVIKQLAPEALRSSARVLPPVAE